MTELGLNESTPPKTALDVTTRSGFLRHVGIAVSGAGGAAVVMGGYQVLRAEPAQAFALLQAWGPFFLIALVAILVLGKFLEGTNQTVRESFNVVAEAVKSGAEAAGRTADALTRLADQGSRQAEQVERLAIYSAQEFPRVYERFDTQDAILKDLASSLDSFRIHVDRGRDEDSAAQAGGTHGSGRA
jgi:hypothetical protein